MNEIVKDFNDPKINPKPEKIKVKQPLGSILFSVYLIIVGICTLGFFGLAIYEDVNSFTSDSEVMTGVILIGLSAFSLLISAVLIFMRQYMPAGMLTITSGIVLSFAFWFVGIPTVIVGVLILRSKEKLEDALFSFLNNSDPIHIKELSEKLKRTEADIEIAIHTLNNSGKNINFNIESRIVSV